MTIEAYPLQWPEGWPRTAETDRKFGRFSTKVYSGSWPRNQDITLAQAVRRVHDELHTMDGSGHQWKHIDPDTVVISTNLRVRKADGGIASGQRDPEDPGAALYFMRDGRWQNIPCDSYTKVAQNIAAIAATLSALRAIERHGSGLLDRAFTGFEALEDMTGEAWWVTLECQQSDSHDTVRAAYLHARRHAHPDGGGSNERFHAVQRAWEEYNEGREA